MLEGTSTSTSTSTLGSLLRPNKHLRFTLLSFGTRGDVQPFVALGKALIQRGHSVRLATNLRFKAWVEQHGIEFRSVGNDETVLEIMQAFSTYGFIHPYIGKLMAEKRVENFYTSVWSQAVAAVDEGTDFILGNVFFICGQHIAESRDVPYFEVMPMVMFRTSSVPAVLAQNQVVTSDPSWFVRNANSITHDFFSSVWAFRFSSLINRFRKNFLNMSEVKIWDLYQYMSLQKQYEAVCTFTPLLLDDIPSNVHAFGTWFLEDSEPNFSPSTKLKTLLETSSDKLIYIGFGSIRARDPIKVIRDICKVIKESDVSAVIAISGLVQDAPDLKSTTTNLTTNGYSATQFETNSNGTHSNLMPSSDIFPPKRTTSLLASCMLCAPHYTTSDEEEALLPSLSIEQQVDIETHRIETHVFPGRVVFVNSIPHEWIFPRVKVVVHHGGTGTMMAALKAGTPQVVKPFFGDQFIWGSLVQRNNIGKTVTNMGGTENIADGRLAKAVKGVLANNEYKVNAEALAAKVAKEDGLSQMVVLVEKEYARYKKAGKAPVGYEARKQS
ncbi:Sterol 3-beta-glucosyltransferase [Nowakowskiella sp. JEL0078]|nr:Sterol 3-beta-glucosyltransferase [Nowakowskiella sp. JEL0078]